MATSKQETQDTRAGQPWIPGTSDADVIIAIRGVLWEAMRGREIGGDRTLVGLVKQLVAERDEARENRKGEFDLRMDTESALSALQAQHEQLQEQIDRLQQEKAEYREQLQWAERQLTALVTEDDGSGAFIRGTGTELAGFGAGMERLRGAIKRTASAPTGHETPAAEKAQTDYQLVWHCQRCGKPAPEPRTVPGETTVVLCVEHGGSYEPSR